MGAGTRIKIILEDTDVKQKAFAKQLGIPEGTMSNYLRETRTIPYDLLAEIAQRMHTTTDYLLGVTESPARPLLHTVAEQCLLQDFRQLSGTQKELIVQSIKLMRAQNERGGRE